jgi:hypothetical protein
MKYKTTKKAVLGGYAIVLKVGYCGLQFLLKGKSPVAYTCGADGWHSDIYEFGRVAICTGYQPFGVAVPYEMQKKYDNAAMAVTCETWEQEQNEREKLIKEFLQEVGAKSGLLQGSI